MISGVDDTAMHAAAGLPLVYLFCHDARLSCPWYGGSFECLRVASCCVVLLTWEQVSLMPRSQQCSLNRDGLSRPASHAMGSNKSNQRCRPIHTVAAGLQLSRRRFDIFRVGTQHHHNRFRFDILVRMHDTTHKNSQVLGVVGGTVGLFEQSTVEVTDELLDAYRNQGGFDLLGRSRDSIRTEAELAKAKEACAALDLDGLVVSCW